MTGDEIIIELHRRSNQWAFLDIDESKFKNFLHRLEDITFECVKHETKGFKVLHYVPGTYFRVHSDFIRCPTEVSTVVQMKVIPSQNIY